MVNRYYSSSAVETALSAPVSDSATSITVDSTTGYPASVPFTILVELGTSSEEIMEVTGVAGSTWTVTRGVDGSTGLAHSAGATVVHGVSARDIREAQEHISATSGIHGLSGTPVGTSDAQTLSNKTLATPTIADFTNAGHTHAAVGSGGNIPISSVTNLQSSLDTLTAWNNSQDDTEADHEARLDAAETTISSHTTTLSSHTTSINDHETRLDTAESYGIRVCTSGTRPASPVEGTTIYETDTDRYAFYTGSSWVYRVLTPTQVSSTTTQTQSGPTTAYAAGSSECSTTFIAPASGSVYVTVSGAIECESPSTAYLSYEIRLGSSAGAVVSGGDAVDQRAIAVQSDGFVQASFRWFHTGLTPHTQTYFIRTMLRTTNTASTASAFWRGLLIEPLVT